MNNAKWHTDRYGRRYRILGESGLREYEDGAVADAAEVDNKDEAITLGISPSHTVSKPVRKVSPCDPGYWRDQYDPRYCGPDIDEYCERAALNYRMRNGQKET